MIPILFTSYLVRILYSQLGHSCLPRTPPPAPTTANHEEEKITCDLRPYKPLAVDSLFTFGSCADIGLSHTFIVSERYLLGALIAPPPLTPTHRPRADLSDHTNTRESMPTSLNNNIRRKLSPTFTLSSVFICWAVRVRFLLVLTFRVTQRKSAWLASLRGSDLDKLGC